MVMASKLCDSCKLAVSALFCQADSAFLCVSCDSNIHAANKLASRHARVWLCEVCEQAPAHATCKADAAALCASCDHDIHSANPLAQRHERVPVTPFYDTVSAAVRSNPVDFFGTDNDVASKEEAEAESWLLPNLKIAENLDVDADRFMFSDADAYLDLEFAPVNPKIEAQEQNSSGNDGVVPVQSKVFRDPLVNDDNCFEMEFSKPFNYGYSSQFASQSVSSSSLDFGVVPDCMNATDATNPLSKSFNGGFESSHQAVPLSSADRETRVLRYREKRKNRKFEKTIRYASRKAYAETRPRIKGRFAKRSDLELERAFGYGVVPTF